MQIEPYFKTKHKFFQKLFLLANYYRIVSIKIQKIQAASTVLETVLLYLLDYLLIEVLLTVITLKELNLS